jgi:hypothetical protein
MKEKLRVKSVSKSELRWLRDKRTRENWGLRSSRESRPPKDFDPSLVADKLVRASSAVHDLDGSEEPMLVCQRCKGWRTHKHSANIPLGRRYIVATRHEYRCSECSDLRDWGQSKGAVGLFAVSGGAA